MKSLLNYSLNLSNKVSIWRVFLVNITDLDQIKSVFDGGKSPVDF
jgi:hypothetical protein